MSTDSNIQLYFHLAENKDNTEHPFAFLATCAEKSSEHETVQHVPLGRAFESYVNSVDQPKLLNLLLPLTRSAEKSDFLKQFVDTKQVFSPLMWGAREAYHFLQDIPIFESEGIVIKVPNWWNIKKPARPNLSISLGNENKSKLGLSALLDFNVHAVLPDGQQLSEYEWSQILKSREPLVHIRGQWIQVDSEKLTQVLSHWKGIERRVKKEGLSFSEGLRLLSGVADHHTDASIWEEVSQWSRVIEGNWLRDVLNRLRTPEKYGLHSAEPVLRQHLQATLRPYQLTGVQWLWWLYWMGLGGCLADDMGLGKTIQVISLWLLIKHASKERLPHLLIVPTSLLGNWQDEMQRFAPSLRLFVAHSSSSATEGVTGESAPDLSKIDVVMTTYGTLHRLVWVQQSAWHMVVLDEAQAIKNPMAKQTRVVKSITAKVRLILTGTPLENKLLDLWSLFDFLSPGLLGSSRTFLDYGKQSAKKENELEDKLENKQSKFHESIRRLVSPYVLRRLKSDRSIIDDLPDKTEMSTYCAMSTSQVRLYQQSVLELQNRLEQTSEGIKRRGLVLSYLLRFKQICNHPSHALGYGDYEPEHSGKFIRLRALCEDIAEKQEKVLIFTQFREIIPTLFNFLNTVFGKDGLFLHGQTSIAERKKRVHAFQNDPERPFFILSLKAGGTGLNLTAASHVIHFDRWWNPAVENQATDRAYRIGQKKNVLVHKFICQGTIEEKIDHLINEKRSLLDSMLQPGNEASLTELSNADLLQMVNLDIHRMLGGDDE